jgi:Tol biopolymer transport system component
MRKNVLALSAGLLVLLGCSPQINYLTIAVPEEGSLRLTQYTSEDEQVVAPMIIKDKLTGHLVWYAAPLLAVSPDGEALAYLGYSNNFKNLNIKKVSGGRTTVQRTFNRDVMDMSYSPDGKFIAFTERKGGNDNIYMINATEGVAVQQLVSSSASELSPSFTPDGKNLFFAKAESSGYFVWSLNIESSLLTQYTEGFTPNLTPTGNNIVVTRNSKQGGRGEIWMIDLDRGTETLLLSDPVKGYSSPRISPDGKKIVCVGNTEKDKTKPENLDIFLVNTDGSKLTQLTFHGGHDVSPVWSEDGKSIFFISQRGNKDGKFNIWKMSVPNT